MDTNYVIHTMDFNIHILQVQTLKEKHDKPYMPSMNATRENLQQYLGLY